MKKTSKIGTILFLSLLLASTLVLASDIDMNLQPNNGAQNSETTANAIEDDNDTANEQVTNSSARNSVLTNTPSTTITSGSSIGDEALGLTNILNILLIVVGVVLILLGIAILIRMHS